MSRRHQIIRRDAAIWTDHALQRLSERFPELLARRDSLLTESVEYCGGQLGGETMRLHHVCGVAFVLCDFGRVVKTVLPLAQAIANSETMHYVDGRENPYRQRQMAKKSRRRMNRKRRQRPE